MGRGVHGLPGGGCGGVRLEYERKERDRADRRARGGSGASRGRRGAGTLASGQNGVGPALLLGCGTALLGQAEKRRAGSGLRDDWATAWLAIASAGAAHKRERRESGKKWACGKKKRSRPSGLIKERENFPFLFYFQNQFKCKPN